MPLLVPTLRRLGGVAETRELRARGIRPAQLSPAVACGDVIRVGRGWYAVPDTPDDLMTAVRIGGRLACVSAASYYGWATPERHGVHVCVAENAARLRRPPPESGLTDLRDDTIVHWGSPVPRSDRARLITSRFETVVQLVGCLDPEHAVAALDSFLHSEPELSAELETWLCSLPTHLLVRLSSRSALCESFLETVGRIRLGYAGIVGAHQVEIAGVGRVDLVIDGRIIIEWDGRQHEASHEEDCRRDALLTAMGYHVLRFSYRLVMDEWHIVIAAVRAALALA